MTYFAHYYCTPELGLREAINHILATDCTTNDGLTKEANYLALRSYGLKSLVPTTTKYVLGVTWGYGDTFMLAPKVTSSDLKEIIEIIDWLTDNCVLSETIYSDLTVEHAEKLLTEHANDFNVDPEVLIDLYNDSEHFPYEENGEVELNISYDALTELAEEARVASQTEHTHYYGGQWHVPAVCPKCLEFPDLVGARANEWSN